LNNILYNKMYSYEIVKSFHVQPKDYDYSIVISVNGLDNEEKLKLLESIYFDLDMDKYKLMSLSPEINIKSLNQCFFIKIKK